MTESAAPHRIVAWFRTLNPNLVDGMIAGAFVVIGFVGTAGRGNVPKSDYQPMDAFGILLVLGATVPFAFRRRAPLAVLVVAACAVVALSWLGYNEGVLPIFLYVAAMTVGNVCTTRKTVIGATFMLAALVALLLVSHTQFDARAFAINVAIFSSAFMIGVTIRARRLRIVALEERSSALEREQLEESRRAVADERLRIARELHDVIADSMGVIAVQAGVGEHLIDQGPADAKRALQAISTVSRSTLVEIRRMLGVLRDDDETASYVPRRPVLDDLDSLTHELDGAGVHATVVFEGPRRELPRGVEVNVYRIIQEALTNVLKHSGSGTASVVVRFEAGAVSMIIKDDGKGAMTDSSGGGHGLVGMRERVALFGGTLTAGPRPGGGFQVAARLPYEADAA